MERRREFHIDRCQNYPNPFNPTTKTGSGLPQRALTRIVIYDLLRREIQTNVNEELGAAIVRQMSMQTIIQAGFISAELKPGRTRKRADSFCRNGIRDATTLSCPSFLER